MLKGKADQTLDPELLRPAGAGWTLKIMLQGQRRIKQFLRAKIGSCQLTGEKTRYSELAKCLNPTVISNLGQNISKSSHLY